MLTRPTAVTIIDLCEIGDENCNTREVRLYSDGDPFSHQIAVGVWVFIPAFQNKIDRLARFCKAHNLKICGWVTYPDGE